MPKLLLIGLAPVIDRGNGVLALDVKFVEGMRVQAALWDGPVTVVLWLGAASLPFGADRAAKDLGFELILLPAGAPVPPAVLAGRDMVAAPGDSHLTLGLPSLCAAAGAALVYSIEYTLGTRLQIVALDSSRRPLTRAYSALWAMRQEMRRRVAFAAADAVQANGFPAYAAYRALNRDTLLYLDNRIGRGMMATDAEMAARAARLRGGTALRLVHSGRLEPMKGAQDLLPVARGLMQRSVDFTLDIYGTGSLAAGIARAIAEEGLGGRVRLHNPVDFETGLVPVLRREADAFLSCHRQADPSCTYLESMGCGLPVVGYDNAMWRALMQDSGAGWSVRLGDTAALAACIAGLLPEAVTGAAERSRTYAQAHDFESEFAKRMDHLARVLARRKH